jgi:DNA-binding transcriptional LysR family regulator
MAMTSSVQAPAAEARRGRFSADVSARSLHFFLTVCDAGSMTGAAVALGVSQAAVSQQMTRLEALVDAKLFVRGGEGLRLTPAGTQFRYHASRIVEALRQAELAMTKHSAVLVPRIVCGLMETVTDLLSGTLIDVLTPMVGNIEISSSIRYELTDGVGAPLYDIAVVAEDAMIPGAQWFELMTEPGVLLVPKGFFRGPVDLEALAERLPLIRFNAYRHLGVMIDRYLQKMAPGIPRRLEFDRVSMVVHQVANGTGWAITTPYSLLQSSQTLDRIDVHPLPAPGFRRTIVMGVFDDNLLDIPQLLVQAMRRRLAKTRDTTIARIAPRTVADISIPDA